MQEKDTIVCLVGESGSGKTSLAEAMEEFGYKQLFSYTTRPPRYKGEKGHTFVTPEEFDAIRGDLVAYTMFNGYEYGATRQQVQQSHLYVIDPDGVNMLAERYGKEHIIVVYLQTDENERFNRMVEERGWDAALERLEHDREKFAKFHKEGVKAALIYPYINNDMDDFNDNVLALKALLERVFS
jgi:guanylate kinase